MKQISKILGTLIVMFAFSAATFAQVQATAEASAYIVSPIAINKTVDLNFGNVAVSASPGTVVLTPMAGLPTRTPSGGVTLPATTGSPTAAAFHVTGTPAYTFSIAISPASVTISNGAVTMTVDGFVSAPTVGAGGTLDGTGALDVYLGGTLNVAGGQAAGLYTNATAVTMTVNYN